MIVLGLTVNLCAVGTDNKEILSFRHVVHYCTRKFLGTSQLFVSLSQTFREDRAYVSFNLQNLAKKSMAKKHFMH